MNKRIQVTILIIFLLLSTTALLYASPKILMQHRNMEKGGKKIDCNYCHANPVFTIEQKKGQLGKDSLNGVPFSKIKTCAGSGCH